MTLSGSKPSKSSSTDSNNISTSNGNIEIKDQNGDSKNDSSISYLNYYDNMIEAFKQNMQSISNIMEQSWPSSLFPSLRFTTPFEFFDKISDTRLPICDVVDRGDKYEINFEVPGINKDKINVKATKNSITVSALQKENFKERNKKYVYSERSFKSFKRQIPFSEEIVPSQIKAKVKDGILEIEIPKKNPSKSHKGDEVNIEVN